MDYPNWIADFIAQNNRSPRILHISNIANNAYQNAKILNNAGCDCDVLCNDAYHVMGCPEWEDADYEGEVGDHYYPKWHRVNLNGFVRPRWFAQGDFSTSVEYLVARRKDDTLKADKLWNKMRRQRILLSEISFLHTNKTALTVSKIIRFARYATKMLVSSPAEFFSKVKGRFFRVIFRKNIHVSIPTELVTLCDSIKAEFSHLFPDRVINFEGILLDHIYRAKAMEELFNHYDIIEGYAYGALYPYLVGYKNYIAFEHGTIRDFPTDNTGIVQLVMLAYAKAKAVYLTNLDCVESGKYIVRNSNTPLVYGLHGMDIERMFTKFSRIHEVAFDGRFGVPENETLFFWPARHDYETKYGAWLKGDDKLINAAARLANEGYDFTIVMLEWGKHVERVKDMLKKIPVLESKVKWHSILPKYHFYKALHSVNATLDEFFYKAYGGIVIETLAIGRAVLITIEVDKEDEIRFFGENFPCLPCNNEDDIYKAMKYVIDDPATSAKIASQGPDSLRRAHSHEAILNKQLEAFSYCAY